MLAARGMRLILAARATERLETLAAEIRTVHGRDVHVLTLDLSRPDAPALAKAFADERGANVDLLINNAGFMTCGPSDTLDPMTERDEIQVNCAALVGLTHAFLPGMLARRRRNSQRGVGRGVSADSVHGRLCRDQSVRRFVFDRAPRRVLAARRARRRPLSRHDLDRIVPTRRAAHIQESGERRVDQVVATGLRGLEQSRSVVVDGWKNRLLSLGPRLVPGWFSARQAGKMVTPKSGWPDHAKV
ncbi:MAG: SDR family NAD(P)-dependent oxidoreductase [Pirellulales bacterium]